MIENINGWQARLEWALGIAGSLGGLVILWRKVSMSQRLLAIWHKTFGKTHYMLLQELRTIKEHQETFRRELQPNGGGSMKDVLNRIEHRQLEMWALNGAQLQVDRQAMFVTDENGKVTSNNYQHQLMTGFSVDQVMGDGWINVIAPEDRDTMRRKWNEAVAQKREFSENVRYIRPSTGEIYEVHVRAARQLDSEGNLRGWLGVVTQLDYCPCGLRTYRECSHVIQPDPVP